MIRVGLRDHRCGANPDVVDRWRADAGMRGCSPGVPTRALHSVGCDGILSAAFRGGRISGPARLPLLKLETDADPTRQLVFDSRNLPWRRRRDRCGVKRGDGSMKRFGLRFMFLLSPGRRSWLAAVTALVVLEILAAPAAGRAQGLYGSLVGTVTDESGAAVPGATITITHHETNASRETVSDSAGPYR